MDARQRVEAHCQRWCTSNGLPEGGRRQLYARKAQEIEAALERGVGEVVQNRSEETQILSWRNSLFSINKIK